jgi:RimJ/RimL family protein N-acetyltransferase
MKQHKLSVREINKNDIEHIVTYWMTSSREHLEGMGVDLSKLPSGEEWVKMLSRQIELPYEEKQSYCIIWEVDGKPSGHSNINKIIFGEEAYMHLHIWNTGTRQKGTGSEFVKMTLPYFFSNYDLKNLYCEPYALNPAPNKTLEALGFEFIKKYTTIPGSINFEQEVNRWKLSSDRFRELYSR